MTLLIPEQNGSETGCEIIQEDLLHALQNLYTALQIVSGIILPRQVLDSSFPRVRFIRIEGTGCSGTERRRRDLLGTLLNHSYFSTL